MEPDGSTEEDGSQRDANAASGSGADPLDAGRGDAVKDAGGAGGDGSPDGADGDANLKLKSDQDTGNSEYKKGNYEEAVKSWTRSLQSVKYILDKGLYKENEQKLQEVYEMETRFCLNLAQGNLKLCNWGEAVTQADRVLRRDPRHTKALYRKASALMGMMDFDKARVALAELLAVEPSNAAAKALFAEAQRSSELSERKAKRMSKKMFASASPDRDPREPLSWHERALQLAQELFEDALRYIRGLPQNWQGSLGDVAQELRRQVLRCAQSLRRKLEAFGILRAASLGAATSEESRKKR